ncbi:hypothetical protein TREMEDRAFT_58708 [Tremella mesenterica DSM 1558]|uniref:uncharacterized protein n=1 Tax=Tremella mesenterica (strain ATCC 24925 / CBS 8224 / DSM 1558 / NBRC 9311 / NRRL Y-6157 / RJB 2259-6 / UBC 559-6) TaxID=578456 RepID=UPI0003F498EC|nr:uncharacterized protein TREMEDRAFT_58708 [Tremella mesenterica DSM 1558]EIW72536.1 hypothetical protein TREMEDRAFT_58708 [Tremella mesenterica DSM 1558]
MRLAALLLASTAFAAPFLQSSKWSKRNLDKTDFQIINLARNLESLELALWNQALTNFTDADFAKAGYTGFRKYIELFRDQEIAHFTGGFKNCTYKFPVTTPKELLTVSQVITTVGEAAFIGASGNLTDPAARQAGASILSNEARQNSKLREESGLDFFNAVNFDTALTASQAYSLAHPFLSSCPSTNPAINFTLIPPLSASFTSGSPPHKAGDEITLTWNASQFYPGNNVHVEFLSDMYSIPMALNRTDISGGTNGMGKGTTRLPQGINGTAFIVATNFDGKGPIPDANNFGIGYVVVA